MTLHPIATPEPIADIAATTALIEMADQLGVAHFFEQPTPFTAADIASAADIPNAAAVAYLAALSAAALVVESGDSVCAATDFAERRHVAGYLSWSLTANRPFIEHITDYLRDPVGARESFQRNGRAVAVTSRWIGEQAFYPVIIETILRRSPSRIVDLGAGTAGLLIQLLRHLPDSTAVAVDISQGACTAAREAAERAGLSDRLTVVHRSIQSLVDDPEPLEGADVIHAGFVLHDLMPEEEETLDALLSICRKAISQDGVIAITDSVPYADQERERRFSALFTFTHELMGRQLLTEQQWLDKFVNAGFAACTCVPHRFPGGRLFVAGA
ncbi:class I SAM-dependent methyltransferase [Nocardia sp. NPDC046473]|uniref:class I SAM-dependent methyltransferase n=1 Tax=Nocardia sp. NPDC046473 TaxID=3155733 RepID=UPI0033FB74B8